MLASGQLDSLVKGKLCTGHNEKSGFSLKMSAQDKIFISAVNLIYINPRRLKTFSFLINYIYWYILVMLNDHIHRREFIPVHDIT